MMAPAVTFEAPLEAPLASIDAAPLARELELYLAFVDIARAPVASRDRRGLHSEAPRRPMVWRAEGVSSNA